MEIFSESVSVRVHRDSLLQCNETTDWKNILSIPFPLLSIVNSNYSDRIFVEQDSNGTAGNYRYASLLDLHDLTFSIQSLITFLSFQKNILSTRECVQVLAYFKNKRESNVLKIFNEEKERQFVQLHAFDQSSKDRWKLGKLGKEENFPHRRETDALPGLQIFAS